MSQPTDYQYQSYGNGGNVKSGPPQMVNGQANVTRHNGTQATSYNFTGTPSSQSSRDPSRETSRDPSPTPYLYNQYRSPLPHPVMPPINGQQNPLSSTMPPPVRLPQSQQYPPMYNVQNQFQTSATKPQAPPRDELLNSQIDPPKLVSGLDQTLPQNSLLEPKSQKNDTQDSVQSTQTFSQEQNMFVNPAQQSRGQTLYQQNFGGQRMYAKNAHGVQHATIVPSTTSYGMAGSGQMQAKPPNAIAGFPGQRTYQNQPPNPTNIPSTPTNVPPPNPTSMPPNPTNMPSNPMNIPPHSMNAPPSSMNVPPNSMNVPPSSINMPPNSMNMPPSSMNMPPSSMNMPPSSMSIPPNSMNMPPNSMNMSPNSMSMPPNSMNMPPNVMNVPPNSMNMLPSSMNMPPSSMNMPPNSMNMPPSSMNMPPNPINMPPNSMSMQQDSMNKRYSEYPDQMNQLNNQMNMMNVTQAGYSKLWGMESIDLLQSRNILPPGKVELPKIKLHQEFLDSVNCSPDIFRCTLTKIPETNSLLQKSRLPLGVLVHPFKDLNHLPVIQCSTIVRCRACRTYINPFVYFNDSKRWKCNLCHRINELPEEFQFDPVTKSYGDPSRRPEVRTSTIEFIASSEYMLRPPQPAVYLFVLDVSRLAVESGYLNVVCNVISEELLRLPGDGRTQIGFLAVDSAIHFFSIPDNVSQPQEMIMLDIDDVFLPCPDNLVVNLKEREELVRDLLAQLPTKFQGTHDTNSALGAALQAAYKLMSPTGGRVTVFQTCLPNVGPGLLQAREDPNSRASKDVPHLNPVTDFYKRLALDCSGQQIAVDLFLLNSQYCDLATLSGMCKFSGGCIYHLPLFRASKPQNADVLDKMLRRYLTRKIGFESVLRIRCTRGLSIHTFHGNFFVRSTDLLSLPNVNPDAGFGMQISIEENLSDTQNVCFQAALLYTSSKGERRIRVHTLCLPVASTLSDVLHSADQQCIVGLISKMAVDRSQQSSLSDARDALINVAIDVLSAYKLTQSGGGLLVPESLKLLPLYIISLLKCLAFRSGTSTRLDDRVFAMCQLKTLPLFQLIQMIYPDLYPVHALEERNSKEIDGKLCPQPPRLHLSAEKLHSRGAFLMDAGDRMFLLIGKNIHPSFCINILGVTAFPSIPEELYELPEIESAESERLRNFVFSLQEEKPYPASLQIIRDDSHFRTLFMERLVEDRFESALSYYEFLQHLKTQVK
ncbi:protein transport protein Sec24AB [Calliopsis andreniformis]|uniref:protein transport protein Sec24AB n=1 Tax=Calliopsis andreniformis TaxID=337506 RepID=UPI003FCE4C91